MENNTRRRSGRKKRSAEKTVLSSRISFYKPTTLSSKIPIIVIKDTTVIDFDQVKACIISKSSKIMFLMNKDYSYYIIQIHDTFPRLLENSDFVIVTSEDIYKNNDASIAEIPVFIDN